MAAGGGVTVALDTATPDVAVAAVEHDEVVAARSIPPAPGGRPRAATALMPSLEEVVEAAGGWQAVGLIAVGVGAGSFTGLRIGVATARALAQSTGAPIAGVSTLVALARGARPAAAARSTLALIDARRGECFGALYGAEGSEEWEPFVASPEAICERIVTLESSPLAVGDGSIRFRSQLEAIGVEVPGETEAVHSLAAEHVARLAITLEPTQPEAIEPIYLRRPDAELWRERIRERDESGA
jgi:tRNA threonylcarbamoyladenosine biosynthesis protein TsaB